MRQSVAAAGSVRRAVEAAVAAAVILWAPAAMAGDRAVLDIIGYSADARYFAFEEFGIQDGSGFAYATIYVVDLETDEWVGGTPFHEQADDETTDLGAIRTAAREAAGAELEDAGIEVPAELVAHIGDGEFDEDASELSFGVPGYMGPGSVIGEHRLTLSSFPSQSPEPCEDYLGEAPLGYALTLAGEGEERELHRDKRLPRSRGCPMDYRLYGVALPFGAADISGGVALISVYPFGFEGPDRRFIAVPLSN